MPLKTPRATYLERAQYLEAKAKVLRRRARALRQQAQVQTAHVILRPKKEFFDAFPNLKGIKLGLIRWSRDKNNLIVAIEGNKTATAFRADWFHGLKALEEKPR